MSAASRAPGPVGALGAVALVALLGTAAVALVTCLRAPARPAVLTVRGGPAGGAVLDVPAHGWRLAGAGDRVFYADRRGRPAVAVRAPALFRPGSCPRAPRGSNRGFTGFVDPSVGPDTAGLPLRRANRVLLRGWASAIARGDDPHRRPGTYTEPRRRTDPAAAGASVVWSASRVWLRHPGPCSAPEVVVTVASVRTPSGPAHAVLVRDAGVPGALSSAGAGRILQSLRSRT